MQITPSWDLFVGIFFVIGIAYGFILQRERITASVLSIYVALVITNIWGKLVEDFFAGKVTIFGNFWIKSGASPFLIQTIIFLGVIILISSRGGFGGRRFSLLAPFEILGYSFLNTALVIASIISFMPEEMRTKLLEQSKFLTQIFHYYNWWLILPLAMMLFITGTRKEE